MTALAIIDEHLSATLDRHGVSQVDLGAIQFDFATRCGGNQGKEQARYK